MAEEYQSAFTGTQIDERLGKVPGLEESVGRLSAEIADLKNSGIIVVQDGDTLTIGEVS